MGYCAAMSTRKLSKDIARVVRGLLAERRVTVQEFADSIGQPKTTVYRWINESGVSNTDGIDPIAEGLSHLEGLDGMDAAELVLLALRARPELDEGGLADAIERVRPPRRKGGDLRSIPEPETGT